ncbi:DUF2339 domain-containing protein [Chryseolinea soli]|uniref:DUF2339 domain-containing protein n=1 Tax=Chryseolinea soli TaxID=2321403 RepID=A0A385SKI8_9BACT|nr:DUF2339 domain-containing protein [Chryseolinea soli]AYB31729.1 DUF2339 domain-containing protein [Chryseolinea soli]
MEAFFVFLLAVIFVALILNVKSTVNAHFNTLQKTIEDLREELRKLQRQQPPIPPTPPARSVLEDIVASHTTAVQKPVPIPEKKVEPVTEPETRQEPEKVSPRPPEEVVSVPQVISTPTYQPGPRKPVPAPKPERPGFFERNPDLEKFIGENLANKIGIGILVLGIGFFVKYAIDREWISEIGRVFIGVLCGGILIGVAHRLRKTFVAFSSVLVGGGIAILYLTIYIAFHDYQIFSQTAAFMLMVVITAFAVVLSLGYDRKELAILSILGGFASPFMVSTGEGNYVVLFTYVLILDGGMLVLAYYKKWNVVNIICYAFTILLFGSWLGARFDGEKTSMIAGAMIFATLFYLVFFAMNMINNLRKRTSFEALEIGMLLSTTFFYYAAGMVILNNPHGEDFKGLFTASLGIFNFIFAYTLFKSTRVDKNLVYLLIGLVLTFISLAAPVQLEGNYITLFWAAEAVLLLWLSQKSGIRLMKLTSVIVMALMVISLLMDWGQIYLGSNSDQTLRIIFNKGYITSLVSLASIVLTVILLKSETQERLEVQVYKTLLTFTGIALLYFSQLLELRYHLAAYGFSYEAQNIIIGVYNMVFIAGLLLAQKKLPLPQEIKYAPAVLGVFAVLLYLFFYQGQSVIARNEYFLDMTSATGFVFHYVLVAALLVVSVLSLREIQKMESFNQSSQNAYSWFFVFFYLFVASAELDNLVVSIGYSTPESLGHIITQNHKIGYPILWGVTSFLLIAVGLKTKKKHLRIISLTLFLITLVKLFAVDIRGISEGGKIAAFISLGVLLLVVSFMYQRLKKLLLADEVSTKENNPEA